MSREQLLSLHNEFITMHVLMFGWEFPPHNSGGLGVACYGLAKSLASQNTQVDFVLPKRVDVEADFMHLVFADIANVKIRRIKTILRPYVTSESYLAFLSSVVGKNMYGNSLFEEVERYAHEGSRIAEEVGGFDIIHSHDWLSYGAGMQAQEVSGRPLVVHIHATEVERTGGRGADERVFKIEQEGFRRADKVIAVSGLTREMVIRHYGIAGSKVEVVHNGIDPSWYQLDSKGLPGLWEFKKMGYSIVLFVGRITLSKGVDYLLQAAQKALKHNRKLLFVIAGSGDMERQIINQAVDLGISSNILFAGFARGAELSALYNVSDLFVMPSVLEPFGLVALEALIHGKPVMISKQSGVGEVLNHAIKTDFWDADEMANKILSVTRYPSLKHTLAQNGRAEAQRCSWDAAASKCLSIYNQVAKGAK